MAAPDGASLRSACDPLFAEVGRRVGADAASSSGSRHDSIRLSAPRLLISGLRPDLSRSAMPYVHATVQKCLATIKSVSSEIELIRTEIFSAKGSEPLQQFGLVCANRRLDFRVPQSLQADEEDQQRLSGFLRTDSEQIALLVTQLSMLHELNCYGTWVVSPAATPSLVVGGETRNLLDGGASLLTDVHQSLVDALPGVHEIRVEDCLKISSRGGMRRRPCIRVMATDDIELAAIDTTLFQVHLQALLLPKEFSKPHHRFRVAAWATQLSVGADLMARILNDLGLLTLSLPVTRIVLRPVAQTRAYWNDRGTPCRPGGQVGRNTISGLALN